MANYYSNTRTNYFRVTDETKYAKLFSRLIGENGCPVMDFSREMDGVLHHGFGCEGCINFLPMGVCPDADEDFDWDFDGFIKELQMILPDNEAFVFTEVGHEKLRYLVGYSLVVTNKEVETVDLEQGVCETACKMLNNDDFRTRLSY